AGFALAASLASTLAFGPLLPQRRLGLPPPREAFWPSREDRVLARTRDALLRELPRRGAVVASFEYLAHLARRDSVISAHHVLTGNYTFSPKAFPTPQNVGAALLDATPVAYDDSSAARLR